MEIVLLTAIVVVLIIGVIAVVVVQRNHTETLGQIHTLVNSRLSEALKDITELKKALVDERRAKGRRRV